MFDDLQDDMVLGSSFIRSHGFSTYHETLVEWQKGQCSQQPRQHDRVTTPAERQDAAIHELKRSKIDITACTKKPGTGVPIKRNPNGLEIEDALKVLFRGHQAKYGKRIVPDSQLTRLLERAGSLLTE